MLYIHQTQEIKIMEKNMSLAFFNGMDNHAFCSATDLDHY
jgi:hypothetical protein